MHIKLEAAEIKGLAGPVAEALGGKADRATAAQLAALTERVASLEALLSKALGAGVGVGRAQGAPDGQLMRPVEVAALLGVHRSTVWRMVRAGEFPAAVKVSANRVGWRRAEVEAWVAARKAA